MARPRKDAEDAPEMKRVQMDMAPLTLARLQRMQRRTEAASYGETIRNALLVYEKMLNAMKGGGSLFVRDGGSETRILFAFEDVERKEDSMGEPPQDAG